MTYADTILAGVYMIRNMVTGDRYFGSAVNLRRRSQTHKSALVNGRHGNARLQFSWNKHGGDVFEFVVLAVLDRSEVLAAETRLLAQHVGQPYCYNVAEIAAAPMAGRKHTPESIEKIRAAGRGKTASPETRAKMSAWQKGVARPDGFKDPRKGKRVSESHRRAIAEATTHRVYTDVGRAKRSASQSLKMTDSYRQQISDKLRGRAFTPEHRAKIAETKRLRRLIGFACQQYAVSLC